MVRTQADPPVAGERVAELVARAARGNGVETVLDPFGVARDNVDRGAVPAERLAAFTTAQHLAREGWQAYAAVDSRTASDRFTEAQRIAERVLDLDGGLALHADIALRRGAVLLSLGDREEAFALFRLSYRLDPERDVSLASFPPDVVQAFRTAVTAPGAATTVRLTTHPPAARVEIDGRDLGTAPLAVRLPAGRHIAVVRKPGFETLIHGFEVAAEGHAAAAAQPRVEALRLRPDPETAAIVRGPAALTVGLADEPLRAILRGLIRYGELDGVVLVASVWRRGEPALLGQRCAQIPVVCTPVLEVRHARPEAAAAAAVELWRALAAEPRVVTPGLLGDARLVTAGSRPAPRGPERGEACRWCRSPWLWLGVGAAAVAAGAVWLVARDDGIQPVVTVEPCQFATCR